MSTLDPVALLKALRGANVQFVVIGDPEPRGALRIVVSAHPTNLGALGSALEPFSPAVDVANTAERPEAPGAGMPPAEGPRRIGDPFGTVEVRTSAGNVVLLLGGAHRSLYAGTLAASTEREIAGVLVQWAAEPGWGEDDVVGTGNALGGRLLSLASRLAQLIDRRGERSAPEGPVDASRTSAGEPGPAAGRGDGIPAGGGAASGAQDAGPAPEDGAPSGAG